MYCSLFIDCKICSSVVITEINICSITIDFAYNRQAFNMSPWSLAIYPLVINTGRFSQTDILSPSSECLTHFNSLKDS